MSDYTQKIIDVLEAAVLVAQYRGGDVDTEDGSFATTSIDNIIMLDEAVEKLFGLYSEEVSKKVWVEGIKELMLMDSKVATLTARREELKKAIKGAMKDDEEADYEFIYGRLEKALNSNKWESNE